MKCVAVFIHLPERRQTGVYRLSRRVPGTYVELKKSVCSFQGMYYCHLYVYISLRYRNLWQIPYRCQHPYISNSKHRATACSYAKILQPHQNTFQELRSCFTYLNGVNLCNLERSIVDFKLDFTVLLTSKSSRTQFQIELSIKLQGCTHLITHRIVALDYIGHYEINRCLSSTSAMCALISILDNEKKSSILSIRVNTSTQTQECRHTHQEQSPGTYVEMCDYRR